MDKNKKALIIKIAKLSGIIILVLAIIYLIYGVIGCFYVWKQQPLFSDGMTYSRSYGFLVVGCVYIGFLVLALIITFLYCYFFYLRPYRRKKRAAILTIKDIIEKEPNMDRIEGDIMNIEFSKFKKSNKPEK